MTVGALLGVAAALGLIIALLGFAFRALGRLTRVGGQGGGRLPLEVVARVGITPRQGVAVLRVGERAVVVSVGEGGVHPILELSPEESARLQAAAPPRARELGGDVVAALRGRLKGALRTVLLATALGAAALATGARAAEAAQARAGAPAQAPAGVTRSTQPDSVAAKLLPRMDLKLGGDGSADSGLRLRGTVGTVLVIGLMTLLPTMLLLMTSFTRILVVLHFLRQALGTQNAPPGHLLAALALLLTSFVMAPTLREINEVALQPWVDGRMEEGEMLKAAVQPLRAFMLRQTPEKDLGTFLELSDSPQLESAEEVPLTVLVSAFATSELRTAFQIGFAIFLPFIVIDLVVASVLTSMGMFMLPPAMIALPCKLLLFVLVDGWTLVVHSLAASFH
jgi:flagellar biosynthetic protein FliP